MQTLKMSDDLMPPVSDGSKTCTISVGRRNIQPVPLRFEATNDTCPPLDVEVTSVRVIAYKDVARKDLTGEGFDLSALSFEDAKQDMLFALRRFYPDIHENTEVTVIHFNR